MRLKSVLLITGNPNKLKEFRDLLEIDELRLDYRSLDLIEIQSLDILEIGRHKTLQAMELLRSQTNYDAVLTDDTGLYCKGLSELPGPLVKWFLESLEPAGLSALVKDKDKEASARCVLNLGLLKKDKVLQFDQEVLGTIVKPRGDQGFGWDSIFQPIGSSATYAEMSIEDKNRISHRYQAASQLRNWILEEDGSRV